jgi:flagellar hook-associated protein 3 FlgL
MKLAAVSTFVMSDIARRHILDAQRSLTAAQLELGSGRHADLGRTLGSQISQSEALRAARSLRTSIGDQNELTLARLTASQNALGALTTETDSFVSALVAARSSENGPLIAKQAATQALQSLTQQMNSTWSGMALFGGEATDVAVLVDYFDPSGSAARASVSSAFQAAFGFLPGDSASANLSPTQVEAFLEGPFASLFDAASWQSSWSVAAPTTIHSRIDIDKIMSTSVTADERAIRDLARAYTMVADLGLSEFSDAARQTILDASVELATEAIAGLRSVQASLGQAESAITDTNARLRIEIDLMTSTIDALEGVEPHEAATRVNAMLTDLETSYAVAVRLRSLTLLNYL